jgi:hypothetical protein
VSPDWRYIHTHFGIGYRFAAAPVGIDPSTAPVREILDSEPSHELDFARA